MVVCRKGIQVSGKYMEDDCWQGLLFGTDGYLFVECYIKSAVNNTYYWVDDDGVWLPQYNTTTPDPGYRVVENYAAENAYQG